MSNTFFKKIANLFKNQELTDSDVVNNDQIQGNWSNKEIQEFKERLLIEKEITTSEIDSLKDRILDINDYTTSGKIEPFNSEYNTFESERITSEIELKRLQKYLNELDKALIRIREGKYGICSKCNCKINKERLLAVPTTTLSASWKIQGKCPDDGIDTLKMRNPNA
jgi:RNA polymerase-binding transcription factor DksA